MDDMRDKLHPGSEQPPEENQPPLVPEVDSTEDETEEDGVEAEVPQIDDEFVDLNDQMDQISTFLDDLEQKNDNLQEKLRQLLAMSKEDRLAALADQINMMDQPAPEQP